MKIIIRYSKNWGKNNTFSLEVNEDVLYEELKSRIHEKMSLRSTAFIIKVKRDGFMVNLQKSLIKFKKLRLSPNFPLSLYEIKEKSILYIEILESIEDQTKTKEERINTKYLEKLGLLNSIDEEDEKFDNENKTTINTPNKITTQRLSKRLSSNSGDSLNEPDPLKSFEMRNYIEIQTEILLKQTKKGDIEKIVEILESLPNKIPEDKIEEVKTSKKKLFDNLGSGGWNALHFSIFYGDFNVFNFFLNRKADINKLTQDEWTPLLLAVHKNHIEIIKILLKQPLLNINVITSKGSALHLACKQNKVSIVNLIISHHSCDIKNLEGYYASDLTENKEISNFFDKRRSKDNTPIPLPLPEKKKEDEFDNFIKPPIIKGFLYKIGNSNLTLNLRYFLLNADDGTFIRYKSKEDCPLKPLEIVPLKDIKEMKYKQKTWYMKQSFYYFEIKTLDNRSQIIGCKYKSTLKAWVKHISDARNYAISIEEKLNEIKDQNYDNNDNLINYVNRLSLSSRDKIIILEDKEKEEDRSLTNSLFNKNSSISNTQKLTLERSRSTKELANKGNQTLKKKTSLDSAKNLKEINGKNLQPNDELEVDLNFNDDKITFKSFKILRVLGSGAFGKVFMVRKKDTGQIFAMKALKKRTLIQKKQLKYAVSEANILKNSNHPYILKLHYAFQTPQFLYLVLDYCSGGDLSLLLAQQIDGKFEENIAKFFICELILAIEYLHKNNIIYRDLKPENILLSDDGHIKLADFGLSKEGVGDNDKTRSFCGSPAYLSPEMVKNKGASKATDIYGLGTVLYEMITGNPPYYADDIKTMYRNIEEGNLEFPEEISEEAQNLIRKLMSKEPESRIGLKNKFDLKNDEFFKGIDWDKVYQKKYDPPKFELEDEIKEPEKNIMFADYDYDELNSHMDRVPDFSFIANKHF